MPGDGVVDLQDRVPTQNVVYIAVEYSLSDGKFDLVALLQGSAFPVVSEGRRDASVRFFDSAYSAYLSRM